MGRSNARAGPSQSQRRSQTQRTRTGRSQVEEIPEEEEDEENNDDDDNDEEEGGRAAMDVDDDADSELTRRANDLVRLALFTEHKRTVLRRDEINKKVMGTNTRAFNHVFELAQQKLRDTFGMELAELSSRAGLERENNDEEENEARKATGVRKKASATGTKTYILRSSLDPILVEHAAQTEPNILEEEAGDQSVLFPSLFNSDDEGDFEDDEDDDAERVPKYYGSLISWTKGDQLGAIGVLYVILALVLVNGRVMTDMDLRRHLKALHLPSNPNVRPIRYTASSTTRSQNIDGYLSQLLKQGYLDRQQVGGDTGAKTGKKPGGGSKRLRTQAEDLEGRTYEWRWGVRAFSEVGEENIGKFIAEFMVSTDVNQEEEGRGAAAARTKEEALVKKMYTGVEKAAGGKLMELK
ncbi:MAGE-domain-containing protein [Phlegmacium glaucopus]|nr:MAGE-domain-containing protein [Phlegmacium glaucopus]